MRANGGNVTAGKTYVVGERGREMFTPNTNGKITPNDEMGKFGKLEINFGGVVINDRGDVDYFMEQLARNMELGKV